MDIIAYTDGRFKNKKSVSVAILYTPMTFLSIETETNEGRSSYFAELNAVLLVARYVKEHHEEVDSVIIRSDLQSISTQFEKFKQKGTVPSRLKFYKMWSEIMDCFAGKSVLIRHVMSHQEKHTPNKVCDILARLM